MAAAPDGKRGERAGLRAALLMAAAAMMGVLALNEALLVSRSDAGMLQAPMSDYARVRAAVMRPAAMRREVANAAGGASPSSTVAAFQEARQLYELAKRHDKPKDKMRACYAYHASRPKASEARRTWIQRLHPSLMRGWAAPQLYATSAAGRTRFLLLPKSASTTIRAAISYSFHDLYNGKGEQFKLGGEGHGFYWSLNATAGAFRKQGAVKADAARRRTDELADMTQVQRRRHVLGRSMGGMKRGQTIRRPSTTGEKLGQAEIKDKVEKAAEQNVYNPGTDLHDDSDAAHLLPYFSALFLTEPIDRFVKGAVELHLLKRIAAENRRGEVQGPWYDELHFKLDTYDKNRDLLAKLMQLEFPLMADDLYNTNATVLNGRFDVHSMPMMVFIYSAIEDATRLLSELGDTETDPVDAVSRFVGKTESFEDDWEAMLRERTAYLGANVPALETADEAGQKNHKEGWLKASHLLGPWSRASTMPDPGVVRKLCAALFVDYVCTGYAFPPQCAGLARSVASFQSENALSHWEEAGRVVPLVY